MNTFVDSLWSGIQYILGLGPTTMLPIIIFIMAICFRVKAAKAIRSAITVGVGFIGVFMIMDYLTSTLGPVAQSMAEQTGRLMPVTDLGWPPLAAIAFASPLAVFIILLTMVINIIMIRFNFTRTIDIDLWNYWHFAFVGAMVHIASGKWYLGMAAAAVTIIVCFKLADWSAPRVQKYFNLPGISLPTLSAVVFYPMGVFGNWVIDKIPGLRKLQADPATVQKRFGIFGEPMMIGLFLGMLIAALARYSVGGIIATGISMGAVMLIMPRMVRILMEGLIPLSDAIRDLLRKRWPLRKDLTIGLDIAVAIGNPAVISTALLMTPLTILLAFIVPGNGIMPLGDIGTLTVPLALMVLACRGNIVRAVIIAIPVISVNLLIATKMAPVVTNIAKSIDYKIPEGSTSLINSFLDGGNPFRYWMVELFSGNFIAIGLIPVIGAFIWWLVGITRKEDQAANTDQTVS